MKARDPDDAQRGVSPLELFFDLCFVVAIAHATTQLSEALVAGDVTAAVLSYLTVFFAVWWAWMNFTWFASAYDSDDVPYRLATFVQIVGALILAAGTPRAFRLGDFDAVFAGYAVMRIGLITLWLRAASSDPARRATTLRYAVGLAGTMLGWSVMLVSEAWPLWGWWSMAAIEMAVPVWAESAGRTPWNAHHIAQRYGRFLVIVLGQSVLAASNAVRIALDDQATDTAALVGTAAGGLLVVFSLWWLYFARPAQRLLTSNRAAFAWGYGHYFILASAAAVGPGVGVSVQYIAGQQALGHAGVAACTTVPTAVYLCAIWLLHLRPHRAESGFHGMVFAASVTVLLSATFTPWPIQLAGLASAALVAVTVAFPVRPRQA